MQIGQAQQWLQSQSLQFSTEKFIDPNSAQQRGEALPDSLPFVPIWQEAKQQPLPNGNTMLYLPLHRAVMVYYYKPFLRRLRIELNPQGEVVQAHIVEFVAQSLEQILQNEAQWLAKAFASQIEGLEGYALVYDLHHQLLQGHRFQAGVQTEAVRWRQYYKSSQQRYVDCQTSEAPAPPAPPKESKAQIFEGTESKEPKPEDNLPDRPKPSDCDPYIQVLALGVGGAAGLGSGGYASGPYTNPYTGIENGGGIYLPYDPGISKGGYEYMDLVGPPENLSQSFKKILNTTNSKLTAKEWDQLNKHFITLEKDVIFNKMIDYLAQNQYKIRFQRERLGKGNGMGFYGDVISGTISINPDNNHLLKYADFIFEELFHAFQDSFYSKTNNPFYSIHRTQKDGNGRSIGAPNIELEPKLTWHILYMVNKSPYTASRYNNKIRTYDTFKVFVKDITNTHQKLPSQGDINWEAYQKVLDFFLIHYKDTSYDSAYINQFLPEAMLYLFNN